MSEPIQELTIEQQEAIETTVKNFDVNRVLLVMQALSWRWVINGSVVPPTRLDILHKATELLIKAVKDSNVSGVAGYCFSGGIEASFDCNHLRLQFVAATTEYEMVLVPESKVPILEDYESLVKRYAKKH